MPEDNDTTTTATTTTTVIGTVEAKNGRFAITIDPQYRPGLEGLADFSHVMVAWWADRTAEHAELGEHEENTGHGPLVLEQTPYVEGPDRAGVFATRSPLRPTPLGISVAGIVSIDEVTGTIELGWIDAVDETPVVDIKPYFPSSDRVRDVAMPSWCASWPANLEESATFDWEAVLREG
jgi:tRNA-Thr(GGU) m(6)t(6)A37 methyltransferase TsaA